MFLREVRKVLVATAISHLHSLKLPSLPGWRCRPFVLLLRTGLFQRVWWGHRLPGLMGGRGRGDGGGGRGYEGCADAELCWQLMASDGGALWGRPNISVSQAQHHCQSGPTPLSLRPNTSVSQAQHQCQSSPTPLSLRSNTSVSQAQHRHCQSGPTPMSVRPKTSVSQGQSVSQTQHHS